MAAFQTALEQAGELAGRTPVGLSLLTQDADATWLAVQTSRDTLEASVPHARPAPLFARAIHMLAEALGLAEPLPQSAAAGQTAVRRQSANEAWQGLLLGRHATVRHVGQNVEGSPAFNRETVIFPGAFHPLHAGHRRMANVARDTLGVPVAYEIAARNVDKPPLDFIEMQWRLGQFAADDVVWFTRAGTFVEKARMFPGATFVVGVDTIARVAQTRYYGDSETERDAAIAEFVSLGCRFLVFGRLVAGRFHTLDELQLPGALRDVSQSVPAERFREDVSSTQLRVE